MSVSSVICDHNMAGSSSTSWTEKLFKVLVIGDLDVGKSSIILRYANKRFDKNYRSSIGVDFALKTIEWDPGTVVRLQFWDIAGECQQECLLSDIKIDLDISIHSSIGRPLEIRNISSLRVRNVNH